MLTNENKRAVLNRIFSEMINGQQTHAVQRELRELLLSNTNEGKLYKYRPVNDYALHNLQTQTLYCAKASTFNDPFDCRIGVDLSSLSELLFGDGQKAILCLLDKYFQVRDGTLSYGDCTEQEQAVFSEWDNNKNVQRLLEDSVSLREKDESEVASYLQENFGLIVELMKPVFTNPLLLGAFPFANQLIQKFIGKLTPTSLFRLSDAPFELNTFAGTLHIESDSDEIGTMTAINNALALIPEGQAAEAVSALSSLEKRIFGAMNRLFNIGCLCTDYKNHLMWSHYADSHRGICIEYDFTKAPDEGLPLPVVYDTKRIKIPWEMGITQTEETAAAAKQVFLMALLTKDSSWEYENEWRMIIPDRADQNLYLPFISCVYLGAQISNNKKKKVTNIAKKLHIPVKQMTVDRGEYALHANPI